MEKIVSAGNGTVNPKGESAKGKGKPLAPTAGTRYYGGQYLPESNQSSDFLAELREPTDSAAMMKTAEYPRRRLRDRLLEREGTSNPALAEKYALQNQLLLIDDDLRETALAMGSLEAFLSDALQLLENDQVKAADLARLAAGGDTLDRMDTLAETVTSLRRRLLSIASQLR